MADRKPKVMKVEVTKVNLSDEDAPVPQEAEQPPAPAASAAENEAVRQAAKAARAALRGGASPL